MPLESDLNVDFSVDELLTSELAVTYNALVSTIFGTVKDYRGQIVPNGRVFLYPKWGAAYVLESDDAGYFEFSASEGEELTLVIPDSMYDKKIIVPAMEVTRTKVEYSQLPVPETPTRFNFPTIRFRV